MPDAHLSLATAGVVINTFLAIVIGSFALALIGPEIQGNSIVALAVTNITDQEL